MDRMFIKQDTEVQQIDEFLRKFPPPHVDTRDVRKMAKKLGLR